MDFTPRRAPRASLSTSNPSRSEAPPSHSKEGSATEAERREAGNPLSRLSGCQVDYAACRSRSEEHTSELQSLMRISYAVFCLKKKTRHKKKTTLNQLKQLKINNKIPNSQTYFNKT